MGTSKTSEGVWCGYMGFKIKNIVYLIILLKLCHTSFILVKCVINLCTYVHAYFSPRQLIVKHLAGHYFIGSQNLDTILGKSRESSTWLRLNFHSWWNGNPKYIVIQLWRKECCIYYTPQIRNMFKTYTDFLCERS